MMMTYIMGWSVQDVRNRLLKSKTRLAEGARRHEHPQNLHGTQHEYRNVGRILERQARQQRDHEANIRSEHVKDEFLDIVKDAATLFDSVQDGRKVIVGENDISRLLGHV